MATSTTLQSIDPVELARCLFHESNDALWVFDPDSLQIIDVNPRAQKLTQLSRRQLLQSKLPELFDAESPDLLRDFIDSCQQTRMFHSREAYRLMCDGEPLDVNVTVSRLHTKPNLLGLVAVRDVSDRRSLHANLMKTQSSLEAVVDEQSVRLESVVNELRASEQWLRDLVNDVDAIVWEAELPTWRFTYVSQQAEAILGYPVSQWLNEVDFWVNNLHDDDRKRCVEFCAESTDRGEDHEFDYRAIARDGRIVWLHDIVRVIKDESGTPIRLRGVMIDITDRKKSEEALRESEEQRRRAEEIALVMKVNVGLDGRWLRVPLRFCEYVGYSEDELIGHDWREITHADDRAEGARQVARLLSRESKTFEFEKRHICKNGRIVWSYINCSLVVNRVDEPQFLRTYIRDITEEKAGEEALQQSEARYRSLVEGAPVCIHEIDRDGRLESINPAGLRMVGVEAESDVTGQDYLSFVDDEDRARVSSLLKRAFNGEASSLEFGSTIDGSRRLFSSSFIPIISQSGDVQKVMGTTEDITEKRSAVEALRQSEEKFRGLTEKSAAMVIIAQAERIVYSNPMLSAVSGYSTDELLRLRFLDLIHPDDRGMVAQRYHQRLNGENPPQRYEFKIVTKNGEARWVDFSGQLIDFKGAPAILATWVNVTQRKLAEEQLRQKELQLAHVSRLSTMGEMVAGIAHEINQPLSAIANFATASQNTLGVMKYEDDSPITTWLQQVNEEAVRCGDIIRRLRNFVKKDEDDREWVDLNQVVRDSIALMESTLRHRSVIIDCQMPDSGPPVMVCRVQFQQVLVNLLRNASDAALETPTPRINVHVDFQDGHARLSVEDNGRGVEESHRQRLFDAFFTTKRDGMGMGLAISKSIVEAHGGSLRLDAEHTGGARFHIELPVAEPAKANDRNA